MRARSALEAHDGTVLELVGDTVLAVFHSASDALHAATAIRELVAVERGHTVVSATTAALVEGDGSVRPYGAWASRLKTTARSSGWRRTSRPASVGDLRRD